jgi:hypothetical protein
MIYYLISKILQQYDKTKITIKLQMFPYLLIKVPPKKERGIDPIKNGI